MISFAIVSVIIAALLVGIATIIQGPKHSSGFAALTAFHDFQPRDKQSAIETIMELKEEKKFKEVESGLDLNSPKETNNELQ